MVLATGDPFNFGVGKQLAGLVPADEILCLPQPSAFSLAASRMGWALQDVACVTLHGRALEGIVRHLQPGARILALSWDGTTPAKLAALLSCARVRRLDGDGARVHGRAERARPGPDAPARSTSPTSMP